MNRLLERLVSGGNLSESEASELLVTLAVESPPGAWAGAILAALRAKGESPAELRGFARAMRVLARKPDLRAAAGGQPLVDLVGTGGDGSGSLNLTTGSALLAAAAGLKVAKHGNRSVSSRSGSADVLESLGLPMPLDERQSAACLARTGFTFLFAPHYHPAMAAVKEVRAALGVRTIFNLVGPLTNPAEPRYAVIGAFSEPCARLLADAASGLGMTRAFVVHTPTSGGGWDEATPAAPFLCFDVVNGSIESRVRDPLEYGLPRCSLDDLAGGDARENARILDAALRGRSGPPQDALVLGAALALQVTGVAPDPREAGDRARAAITDGRAGAVLDSLAPPGSKAAHRERHPRPRRGQNSRRAQG
ncbi:MAG: anthranilate phosphoribosyltransferase [Phycisphaerae bacterium]|nr:anthranilate phosphoribosyltransferase [Phycisphaerae bacterium]